MQSPSSFLLAALAATTAAANVASVDVFHIFESVQLAQSQNTPASSNAQPLTHRQDTSNEEECATSVLEYLDSAPTLESELSSFMAAQKLTRNSCSWTAHTSLSSDLMGWFSAALEWERDTEEEWEDLVDECGLSTVDHDMMGCPTGGIVVFTGDGTSSTAVMETAFAEVTGDGGDGESAATRAASPVVLAGAAGLATLASIAFLL